MKKYPIESLLRPVLEFYVVTVDVVAIIALLVFHNLFIERKTH